MQICTPAITEFVIPRYLIITYKALNGFALSYICDLLQVHRHNRNLRSVSRGLLLEVPDHQTQAYGACSFSAAAPSLWNSLPVDIKMHKACFLLKESSKHFYLINIEFSFIALFLLLQIYLLLLIFVKRAEIM